MEPKEYPQQLNRLREEQENAIKETDFNINQWQQFKSDYDALKTRLTSLPDKLTHDVMVPFGKMAFMPGQLVHTNEILVLLGDNWFVERSGKQAVDIVDRRIKTVDQSLEDLYKQRKLLEPRRDFTSELQGMAKESGDMMDIREEYDEEREKKWKESHRKSICKQRLKMKQKFDSLSPEKTEQPLADEHQLLTHEQLWQRLDQLELIESERKEMQKIGTEAENVNSDYTYPSWRPGSGDDLYGKTISHVRDDNDTVSVTDESYSASDELDSDDYEEEENEREITAKGRVIHFLHTDSQSQTQNASNMPIQSADSDCTSITHPGDIYTKFYVRTGPVSILKKTKTEPAKKAVRKKTKKSVVSFDTGSESDEKQQKPKDTVTAHQPLLPAFTGKIVEKTTAESSSLSAPKVEPQKPVSKFKTRAANQNTQSANSASKLISDSQPTENENIKPVSKFKAQRQKSNQR